MPRDLDVSELSSELSGSEPGAQIIRLHVGNARL